MAAMAEGELSAVPPLEQVALMAQEETAEAAAQVQAALAAMAARWAAEAAEGGQPPTSGQLEPVAVVAMAE